jgi:cytochrome c biogenesis protein CcdA
VLGLWFAAGLALGGLATGTLLGLVAVLLPLSPTTGSLLLAAAASVALAVYDLRVASVELPQRRSLIPQEVFLRSPALGFVRFGLEFGSGVRTYVTSAAPYAVALLVLGATDGVVPGALMGLAFGLGRALTPLQAVAGVERSWAPDVARVSRTVERGASVLVAVVAVVLAIRGA